MTAVEIGGHRNPKRRVSEVVMTESRADKLLEGYKLNHWLIHQYVDDVSENEGVLQPPFDANCMNWVLGHIIFRRNSSLACLGKDPLWDDEIAEKYRTGSSPIKSKAQARPMEKLISDLDQSQILLVSKLGSVSEQELDEWVMNDRGRKKAADHLRGFHWHETFHVGQLDLLRAFIESTR
jgi:hypothetical protein